MATKNFRCKVPFTESEIERLERELKPGESHSTLIRRLLPRKLQIDPLPVGRPHRNGVSQPRAKSERTIVRITGRLTAAESKGRRERLGLTQRELAEVFGVDRMTVSRWERGVLNVPPYVDLALAELQRRAKL